MVMILPLPPLKRFSQLADEVGPLASTAGMTRFRVRVGHGQAAFTVAHSAEDLAVMDDSLVMLSLVHELRKAARAAAIENHHWQRRNMEHVR